MVIRTAMLLLVLAGGAASSGCIIVPIPRSIEAEGIRATVPGDQLEFVRPGQTTRRELLLKLGEPDDTVQDGHSYSCYIVGAARTDVHWAFVIPAPNGAAAGGAGVLRYGSRDVLLVRFDSAGVVQKYKVVTARYTLKNDLENPFTTPARLCRDWEQKEPD
jgi:hypothetical protein